MMNQDTPGGYTGVLPLLFLEPPYLQDATPDKDARIKVGHEPRWRKVAVVEMLLDVSAVEEREHDVDREVFHV